MRAKSDGETSYSDSSGNMARRRSRVEIRDSRRSGGSGWVEVISVSSSQGSAKIKNSELLEISEFNRTRLSKQLSRDLEDYVDQMDTFVSCKWTLRYR